VRSPSRSPLALALLSLALALRAAPLGAVERQTFKEIRGTFEGQTLRLRIDLKIANSARDPNIVSLDGVRARERSPVLFGRLERVFVKRITNEGGNRLSLTVYRDQRTAENLRGNITPQPSAVNPMAGSIMAGYARLDSTSVLFELKAGKKEPAAQRDEFEALLERAFYLRSEPTREELEAYVREHRGWPISRLREITGLETHDINLILKEERPSSPAPEATPAQAPNRSPDATHP